MTLAVLPHQHGHDAVGHLRDNVDFEGEEWVESTRSTGRCKEREREAHAFGQGLSFLHLETSFTNRDGPMFPCASNSGFNKPQSA